MGNTCGGEPQIQILEVKDLPYTPPSTDRKYFKTDNISMRFGDIEKLRTGENKNKYILTVDNSPEVVKVQLPVIRSYADQSMMDIGSVTLNSKLPPIIDSLDISSNRQIYHHFKSQGVDIMLKAYECQNQHDPIFKNGLYETALYRQIGGSYFRNTYLFERGNPMSLVLTFNRYDCTLFDLISYRQLSRNRWTEDEQIYIAWQLINNYKRLKNNSIIHRDIRPSKVFIFTSSTKLNNSYQNYELANLQTARKITQREQRQYGKQMLLTVRGVPIYGSHEVKQLHNEDAKVGLYHYEQNDRHQLMKTITALDTCNPYQQKAKLRRNNKLDKVCRKLIDSHVSFEKVVKEINELVKETSVQKRMGILKSDADIIEFQLPQLIKKAHKGRIQESSIQILFLAHLREQFTERLTKMFDENYQNDRPELNVAILDRLGNYYASSGVANNDYYRQEINLLVSLAESSRKRGFIDQGSAYLDKAKQVERKMHPRMKTPTTVANLLTQTALNEMERNNLDQATKLINEALLEGSNSNEVAIDTQLKIIEAKGLIDTERDGAEAGDDYFEKGLELCGNRSNFTTQVQMLQNKATFQYRLAQNLLLKLKSRDTQVSQIAKKNNLGRCQALLLSARETKLEVGNKNAVELININLCLGDLAVFRENYPLAIKMYERADRLHQGSDAPLSDEHRLTILGRISKLYEKNIDDAAAQQKVEQKIRKIKEKTKVKKDPKKNFQKIKYQAQQQRERQRSGIFKKQGIIEEPEEQVEEREEDNFYEKFKKEYGYDKE